MFKRVFFNAAFLFLCSSLLHSQHYFFKNYSIEEGLPQSSVYSLLQDTRGYIWMGTDGAGVARFDGNKFETFTKANGLSDNVVRSLFEDSKGNIWIGTADGLTLYDGYNFKTIGPNKEFDGSSVLKIFESSNGTIWVGTNDKGIFGLSLGDSLSIVNYSIDDGLQNFMVWDIYEDSNKRLLLGMAGGVNVIEFTQDSVAKIKKIRRLDFDLDIESTMILSIEPGRDGTIWLGSTFGKGLFKAVPTTDNTGYKIESSAINSVLPGLSIWDIMCRKDGELWIATDKNGVIKLRDDKISGRLSKETGLPSNQILDIMEDNEGNSWFATFGQGAIMYAGEKFINYGTSEGLIGTQAFSILFDADNIFYTATEEGFSSFRKEGEKIRRLNYFTAGNGLNDVGANTIMKKSNQIWIGTNNGINILNGSLITEFRQNNNLPDLKINCLLNDRNNIVWIGTNGGYGRLSGNNLFFLSQKEGLIHNEVQTILEDSKGRIWMGTVGGLVRLEGESYADFNSVDGLSFLRVNCLAEDPSGNIWIGTFGGGIFKFDNEADSVPISIFATKGILSSNNINSLLFFNDTIVVAGTDKGFDLLKLNDKQKITGVINYNINDGFAGGENNTNSISKDKDGLIWFGTKSGLVRFDPLIDASYHSLPKTFITGIKLFFENVDWSSKNINTGKWFNLPYNLVLSHKDNHVTFDFTGFSFKNPENLMFSYSLEPQSKEWSPFSHNREISFPGLNPDDYSFKVRAKNKYGTIGDMAEFRFIIKPPFWRTKWFIISTSLFLLFIIIAIIRIREKNLINEKIKLENIVKERTREVVEQKDEIAKQRDVVTSQKKEITDSIHYAERIQHAVLPDEIILKKSFTDCFILYMPKDIVSGDFYWMSRKKDNVIFAAADCTGHGVPGAFMSMLGVSFLNKIVNESGINNPSQILSCLRENIISALKQTGSFMESKDGMDIAICSIDLKKMKLIYSGANNPLYLIRKENNEYVVIERKGDKMPVGFYSRMDDYTRHELDILNGDTIYLFSDGFVDQFGGDEGRKFMKPRFKQMLLDNQSLDMASQKEIYIKTLIEWINGKSDQERHFEQIDDIIVLGVRI